MELFYPISDLHMALGDFGYYKIGVLLKKHNKEEKNLNILTSESELKYVTYSEYKEMLKNGEAGIQFVDDLCFRSIPRLGKDFSKKIIIEQKYIDECKNIFSENIINTTYVSESELASSGRLIKLHDDRYILISEDLNTYRYVDNKINYSLDIDFDKVKISDLTLITNVKLHKDEEKEDDK